MAKTQILDQKIEEITNGKLFFSTEPILDRGMNIDECRVICMSPETFKSSCDFGCFVKNEYIFYLRYEGLFKSSFAVSERSESSFINSIISSGKAEETLGREILNGARKVEGWKPGRGPPQIFTNRPRIQRCRKL